jgi:hypothetical protein
MMTLEQISAIVLPRKRERKNRETIIARCMDERNQEPLAGDVALPGATLGLIRDFIQGLEAVLERKITREEFLAAVSILESLTHSQITYHTDDHHADSCIGGCGYCSGDAAGAGVLSDDAVSFIQELFAAHADKGYSAPVLPGTHTAAFVLLVSGDEFDVVPNIGDGMNFYVIHDELLKQLLTTLSETFYDKFVDSMTRNGATVAKEAVVSAVLDAANDHLDKVAANLKANLIPFYRIAGDEITLVREPDMAEAA